VDSIQKEENVEEYEVSLADYIRILWKEK